MSSNLQAQDNQSGIIKIKIETTPSIATPAAPASGYEDVGGLDKVGQVIQATSEKIVAVSVDAFMTHVDEVARGFEAKMIQLRQQTTIDEATLEFGLVADAEGNVYVFKVGSEVNLKVSLKWNVPSAERKVQG